MCTPSIKGISTAVDLGMNLFMDYQNAKTESKNLKYKTQIAINNANAQRNEGFRQRQLGIDNARQEKIEGLKQAKLQAAKNSANGLDMASSTNLQNYRDIIDTSNSNAANVQNEYNLKSDNYFDKANEYMADVKTYQNDYNTMAYKNAINSLGRVKKVADKWYESKEEEEE